MIRTGARMDVRRYFANTTHSGDEVLADWRWLIPTDLQLWKVTMAGDALLRRPADGSVHFLDVMGGTVEQIASDEAAFEAAVAVIENREKWLMPEVVEGQAALGMCPAANECLSFKTPPVLGGQLAPENFETCSVLVHFSIAGQIHKQVKDLPPGTKIGKIAIEEPSPDVRKGPWWKFW
jgi:hypothetical protein